MIADLLIRLLARKVYRKGHIHGPDGSLYMERFGVFETRWLTARVHHIVRPDMDRHMHDHPWWFVSIVLKGWYREAYPEQVDPCFGAACDADREWEFTKTRRAGSIAFRRATDRHSIVDMPCSGTWTLFITGRIRQWWGFYTPAGKVHWRDYIEKRDRARP